MGSFDKLYESLLLEMPYINVRQHGETIKFDLELEKYAHDLDGLKDVLRSVLQDGTVTDKYGDTIHLTTHDERMGFLSELTENDTVKLFLKKYHNTTLVNVVNSIK